MTWLFLIRNHDLVELVNLLSDSFLFLIQIDLKIDFFECMNYLRFYRLSFKYLYSGALIIKNSTTMDYSDEDDHPKM